MSSRECPVHNLETPCFKCEAANRAHHGRGKRQRLREAQDYRPYGLVVHGKITQKQAENFMKQLANDPVRAAACAADARRPFGASKERYGIALRTAAREPMLSANPESIKLGLDYNRATDYVRKRNPATAQLVARIEVKPTCIVTSKYGRNSSFWGSRLWNIHSLKYARGFVAITDTGDFTRSFFTIGELLAAIKKSGWEILK